jgi:glutathione synthase/RimK-type ligase-like ATP-grasp enzyme
MASQKGVIDVGDDVHYGVPESDHFVSDGHVFPFREALDSAMGEVDPPALMRAGHRITGKDASSMKKLAILLSRDLLPGSSDRRSDADLVDLELGMIAEAARPLGLDVRPLGWRAVAPTDLAGMDAVLPLAAWDYQDDCDGFLAFLDTVSQAGCAVFNPLPLIRWNIRKTYLLDLARKGAPAPPLVFSEAPVARDIEEAFSLFGCDRVVLKRQVGAGARGQAVFRRTDDLPQGPLLDRPGLIQPFFESISDKGERSFVFIDGELSHAIVKLPAPGDYRIQPRFGGSARLFSPTAEEREAAERVFRTIEPEPLYARVDMIWTPDDGWCVLELELIEPFLFPVGADRLGALMARGISRRLGGHG